MHPPTAPLRLASLAVCALAMPLLAQDPGREKLGTIFKGDVDRLIGELRQHAPESGGFADGSCLRTAQMLTAMGHCHRFYGANDGPVVRDALRHLFAHRGGDGSFSDDRADAATSTAWAIDALSVMDPDAYRDDVEAAASWLAAQAPENGGFARLLSDVRGGVARGESPLALGDAYLEMAGTEKPAVQVQALVGLVACQVVARELDSGAVTAPEPARFGEAERAAVTFLLTQQKDGVFMVKTEAGSFPDTGLTAMGLAALMAKPEGLRSEEEQSVIEAGLKHLLSEQNDDGSFAQRNSNYTTCAAILALAKADRPEFRSALDEAQRYILTIQNVEGRGYARTDRDYGSIGYGGDQRGDLSNLQFAIEALRASDLDADHEAFTKAIVFLQRTQNLKLVNDFEARVRSEDGSWQRVTSGDDGGSAYYPGNSPAGYTELPDGRRIPRSYGSMTYALLKTYTLAGVAGEDPRVQAAVRWIQNHWTLDENPGAATGLDEKTRYQGLFYYFMVMAQALSATGLETLAVPADEGDGTRQVDWRTELREHLSGLQRADGSWLNERNGRWWENQPVICTIYALLALEHTRS